MGKLIGRFAIIGGVFAVAVVVIVMLFATQPEPQRANSAPRPVAVFVEEAQQGTVSLTVTSQGEARPRTQINLVPQVAGRITYVNPDFIEGGFFEAGETLVQIDDADYRLAVTRLRPRWPRPSKPSPANRPSRIWPRVNGPSSARAKPPP